MKSYWYLIAAIVFEVVGTTMLKVSDGFTKLWPTLTVAICFGIAFTLLVWTLETLPLSLVYSVWSGLGTAGAGVAGVLFFHEILSNINILGFVIIIIGVVVMNLGEKDHDEHDLIEKTSQAN